MKNDIYIPEGGSNGGVWNDVKKIWSSSEPLQLGTLQSYEIYVDIKHMAFRLGRYKFASKMLAYKENMNILELGCNEALMAMTFKQNNDLNRYVGIDMDADAIQWNEEHLPKDFKFICGDFFDCKEIITGNFDAVISLDVIEHIPRDMENRYCGVLADSLKYDGVAIVGTPSIMMSPYASETSKAGHINLYDHKRLYELMAKYFYNVFIFSMNDEVVHTGFAPMACYIFALCCNKK